MHGSDFDLRLLYDFCQFRAKSLFDTMLAAQLLGREPDRPRVADRGQFRGQARQGRPEGQLVAPADHAEAPRLRRARRVVPAGAARHPHPRAEAARTPRLDGPAVQGPDRGRRRRDSRRRTRTTGASASRSACGRAARPSCTPSGTGARSRPSGSTRPRSRSARTSSWSGSPQPPTRAAPRSRSWRGSNLGKRHQRLIGSLAAAVRAGLERDPRTLPRRPGRDPSHMPLTQAEIALLDRIKEERDKIAAKIGDRADADRQPVPAFADRARSPQAGRHPPALAGLPARRGAFAQSVNANIARHLDRMAAAQPRAAALKVPRGRTPSGEIDYLALSFAELLAETDAWCARLRDRGVRRGDRALVMVRPGLPLIASAFALFKLGAVPVIIDPGMGLGNFLSLRRALPPARPRRDSARPDSLTRVRAERSGPSGSGCP